MNNPNSFIKGTLCLAAAGIIIKIIGAFFRIYLARLIGAEGIGLYQMAYPIYLIFLALSNAGLPLAISKVIAEEVGKGNSAGPSRVLKAALIILCLLGITGSAAMALSAKWLASNVVADPRAIYPMWALAPSVLLMSLMAAYRGYFQGWRNMIPSAGSQIIEQSTRVAVALILSSLLLKWGVEHAAAGAAFGATAGGGAGLVYLLMVFWHNQKKNTIQGKVSQESIFIIIKRLVRFALPISISAILMPLLQTLDSIVVPNKLQNIGYTVSQSTSMLGVLGNCWAVLYLPMIITGAIASNLVPNVASLKAAGNFGLCRQRIIDGIRLGVIYLIPISILFFWFGESIYRTIYGTAQVNVLRWFAPAVVFLGIEQITAGILQGLGKPTCPLLNFITGAFFKILITLVATGLPGLNLAGAAIGTVCGSGITASLNLLIIKGKVKIDIPSKIPLFIGGVLLFFCCGYLKRLLNLNYLLEMLLCGGGTLWAYLVILWFSGGFKEQDLEVVKRFVFKGRSLNEPGDG